MRPNVNPSLRELITDERARCLEMRGLLNQVKPAMWAGSICHLQQAAEAYRANHPEECVAPGALVGRLTGKTVRLVERSARHFSRGGHALTDLVMATVELADESYTEIAAHATREGPDLNKAVDWIVACAQRFFEAENPVTRGETAMECARALERYGVVLITKYGSAADVANTQLRILRTGLLANLLRSALLN
jgi:hypothetical protein